MNRDFLDWIVNLGSHYPDLLCLAVGSLVGYTLTVMVESYFLPVAVTPDSIRKQKGLTFLFCWLVSGAASAILWVFLDPADPPAMRIAVSYVVGVLSFPGYPFLAKVATSIWPRVGSAWVKQP